MGCLDEMAINPIVLLGVDSLSGWRLSGANGTGGADGTSGGPGARGGARSARTAGGARSAGGCRADGAAGISDDYNLRWY